MGDVVIRALGAGDDFEAQLELGQRAFGTYSAQQKVSWLRVARLRAEQGLFLGAFAGGVPCGAAMVHDMRQYWLGSPVGCAGVASVKVAPEYQGAGIGRRLMTELLGLMGERGYPLSALFPATVPLYRSLGWELAGGQYVMTVPGRSLRPLLAPDPAAGADQAPLPPVRRATPDDDATVAGVIARSHAIARHAGPLTWDEEPARQWLSRPDLYTCLVGGDGEPDAGFAAYRWVDGHQELFVERVHATTPAALRALWAVIGSHGTMARTVRALTAPDDPVWWLTRERDATITRRGLWMLRVVDAQAAVAARGFRPGLSASVPLEIRDEARPGNAGSWTLAVSDGTGTLMKNDGVSSPDALTLGPRGLAALYAGTPVASLRLAGLAAGGAPEADATLDAVFAATPFMLDDF